MADKESSRPTSTTYDPGDMFNLSREEQSVYDQLSAEEQAIFDLYRQSFVFSSGEEATHGMVLAVVITLASVEVITTFSELALYPEQSFIYSEPIVYPHFLGSIF
jgi:hypothetical protein